MLGVCYYPEHWSKDQWHSDAADMKALGLTYVRIGEFAWSRIEPAREQFSFDWLDRAIDILGGAGLKIIFGIPTATPPKWLVGEHPDILPVDPATGQTRGFGSRRHYDFSSETYQREALRITDVLTRRYGGHDAIVGWQTDNELCCHDTALSGSDNAKQGFQQWCRGRYGDIAALNSVWGNVFWSMEYSGFDDIELPIGAVTETNPAHQLAYRRYSSDKVIEFQSRMIAVIRENAPGKWITHNFIPKEDLGVDPYALGAELDIASYDNYPLGRADLAFADTPPEVASRYMRTGHPDFASLYHDTSRSFAGGDYWVMEQQPGPVNWAPHNPRPAPGMVRLWSWEAFAHGASCVSYFRWRQVPFAQEQMHAGLRRSDNSNADAWPEIEQLEAEVTALDIDKHPKQQSAVAIISDIQALWVTDIQQQGAGFNFAKLEFAYYSALRQLGIEIDFISKDAAFDGYALVIAPCLPIITDEFVARCGQSNAHFIFGPRSGSKTDEFSIPDGLAPGKLRSLLPIRILSVETLRSDCPVQLDWEGSPFQAHSWCEELETGDSVKVIAAYSDGKAAIVGNGHATYIGVMADNLFTKAFLRDKCKNLGIETHDLPDDMRLCQRGELNFAFNYSENAQMAPAPQGAEFLIGRRMVGGHDLSVWRCPEATLSDNP